MTTEYARANVRLIVSDIDGTLLPAGGSASPATAAAVAACRARGVEFVVASGRWYPAARKVAVEQLGIEDGYMIVCNGGAVVRCDGRVLMERPLSDAQAQSAWEILSAAPVMMTAYVRDAIYRLRGEYLSVFRLPETSYFEAGHAYRVVDGDEAAFRARGLVRPYKLEAYCDDPATLAHLRARLVEKGLQVNSSFPFNLEITAPDAGKGTAVQWLAGHLHLTLDQVMGFGDYTNDLSMLACVGWPVAVGNAIDEVKRACRIVAPACADDGVARTLQKYVLGGNRP